MDSFPLESSDTSFPAMNMRMRLSSQRTNSFSFSSSSFSSSSSSSFRLPYQSDENSLALSPSTTLKFSGIPFSWEKLPGIPKKESSSKKKDLPTTPLNLLPLPPPTKPTKSKSRFIFNKELTRRKKNYSSSCDDKNFTKDPFLAAFVECGKDNNDDDQETTIVNHWEVIKAARNPPSDWYGIVNFYTSCKRTCAVSESIVYLPRSSRTSY